MMRFPLFLLALVASPWSLGAEGMLPGGLSVPAATLVAPETGGHHADSNDPGNGAERISPQTPVLGLVTKFRQRSVSQSRQFIVYCPDTRLRSAVTGFVEKLKEGVLRTLGLSDGWKSPIVINMEPPVTTAPHRQLSDVRLIRTEEGLKIQIDLIIREERFREIRFPQQVIRAVLMEIASRRKADDPGDVEPPGWLVEGLAEQFHARTAESPPNAALFRKLIETGRLPPISDFLRSRVTGMDTTSRAVFGECAYSLIEMLTALPQGNQGLGRLVLHHGEQKEGPVEALLRHFPGLGGSEASLEKWWTLGVARFSASDRYLALSVEETDRLLQPLLELELVTDPKAKKSHTFRLEEFSQYLRLPGARALLQQRVRELAMLQTRGHPLMRPVLLEYQRQAMQLARGKTKRVERQLAEIGQYRQVIVQRMDKVTDYLNWYEATQMEELSGAFDGYFRAAAAAEAPLPPRRYDPLTRYIDQVQREFE